MSVEQRIKFFNFIRDIPYHIGLEITDPTYNCATKAIMLGQMLNGLNLKTRLILCTFAWTETPLPSAVLNLPRNSGETHLFLQMFEPRRKHWVNIDPSWDTKLRSAGFPIADWDGVSDTALAVTPHIIYSSDDTTRILAEKSDPAEHAAHRAKNRAFYHALNQWLQSERDKLIA